MQAKLNMTIGPESTTGVYLDGCPLMLCSPVRGPQGLLAEGYFSMINWCQWDIYTKVGVVQARYQLFEIAPMLYLYVDALLHFNMNTLYFGTMVS